MRNHGNETSMVRVRYGRENRRANPGLGDAVVAPAVAALPFSWCLSHRGLSGSQRRRRRNKKATAAVAPTISLQSDVLLLCHRIAIARPAPSSIPTDCKAMVATTIRLRTCLGMVSDT